MAVTDPVEINAELDQLMGERLGVGGAGFSAKVRRAGRLLPRHIRREARFLVEAEKMAAHPKLFRLVDQTRIASADKACRSYLQSIDAGDRRWGIVLGRLAVVVFNLIVLAIIVIAVLVWQGYIGPDAVRGP